MILKNFAKILYGVLSDVTATNIGVTLISGDTLTFSSSPFFGSGVTISNYKGGNTASIYSSASNTSYGASFVKMSLTFGSGTTEPTADDYQMESPYDTTSHFSWENQVQSSVADSLTKVITASIANISEEDLTVSEIGAVIFTSGSYHHILIARSLITPVTIAPNETKTFQYTLDFTGIAG